MSYEGVEPRMDLLGPLTADVEPLPPTVSRCDLCDARITWATEPHWAGWLDDDGDELSYVPTLHNHKPVDLFALRAYKHSDLMRIAAGGGPRTQADHDVVYCPRCNCRKSGDHREPNGHDESCDNSNCPCHDEDLP